MPAGDGARHAMMLAKRWRFGRFARMNAGADDDDVSTSRGRHYHFAIRDK